MKIILRYIFRSILERRPRTALILSAIAISSAMFFASVSISGTLVNMQMDAFRQSYGHTDIVIRSDTDSPSRWFYMNKAEKYRSEAEYIIGEMSGYGRYLAGAGGWSGKREPAESAGGRDNKTRGAETSDVETDSVTTEGGGTGDVKTGGVGMAEDGRGKTGSVESAKAREEKSGVVETIGGRNGNRMNDRAGTNLRGIDIDDLRKLTPFALESAKNLYPFTGMKAVVSSDTARKFGLECGSTMVLEINGSKYRFVICGIFRPTSALAEQGGSFCTIMPLRTLNSLYNAKGRVDRICLKLLNPAKKQRMLYLLSKEYGRYTVKEPFTEWELKRQTDRIATPVVIVTVILSFMCIYIIHTTFKIIVLERQPVIGTFRSIGAEKLTTDLILLLESLAYGLAGGISGCGFGIGLLYAMAALPDTGLSNGMGVRLEITPFQLAATLGIAVLLSVTGSALSIVKTVRISIKDIILGLTGTTDAAVKRNALPGLLLLCLSFLVPPIVPEKLALPVNTACMTLTLFSICLLLPLVMNGILRLLRFVFCHLPGNMPQLAVKMLYGGRNAYSGISMLMIGVSGLYMISTLNWSQIRDAEMVFDRNRYELTITMPEADKTTLRLLSEIGGVKGVLGNYSAGRTEIEGREEPIWHIQGIDTARFPDFQQLRTDRQEKELLASLDRGRNILLSNALKNRLGVKEGDTLVLKFISQNGGVLRKPYKITGFFDTMIKGMWSYALISARNFRADFRERYFGPIYIQTFDDPVRVMNNLKAAFPKRNPVLELKEDVREADRQSSGQLFFMLQGFTGMTMITGAFGILNNLVIGFLQRKRQLAMLRSCGMSRLQMKKMIFTEAAVQGLSGSLLGIAAGLGTTWGIVPKIIRALNLESAIYFSPGITALCFLAGVLAYVPASLNLLAKVSGLDILQAIKQE